jgi:hypothetical protein
MAHVTTTTAAVKAANTAGRADAASSRRKARLLAVMAAVLGAVAVWTVAKVGFGVELYQPGKGSEPPVELGVGSVIFSSAIASLAGWALLAGLERFTAKARTVWAVVAGVVLIGSLGGPLSGEGLTSANRLSLVAMHLVVGAVLIPLLYRTSPATQSVR